MNPIISDPDTKINMSLDEIIRLTRREFNNKIRGSKIKRNKIKFSKPGDSDHSLPLFMSTEGVSIYVSKKSPLLNPDFKQSFLKAVTNRALNAELLEKSTRIIPAKYKLVKTDNGVERILVPVKNFVCKPMRKLHQENQKISKKTPYDEMPQLVTVPVSKPVNSTCNLLKHTSAMEVDNAEDDDVVVLTSIKKEPELIDVEMNMPLTVIDNEHSKSSNVKTLNDRFSRLTGQFQF